MEFRKKFMAKYESGLRVANLARMYGNSASTTSSILAKKKEIKEAEVGKVTKVLTKQRSQTIKFADLLLVWINEKQFVEDKYFGSDNLRKDKTVTY